MEKNEQQMPRLGEPVPAFEAMTTKGKISFPDDYKGKWVILFSHPADFTPICTTEILTFGARTEEFRALNCELGGLSVDSRNSHIAWLKTIREKIEYKGMKDVKVGFPIIDDVAIKVASLYGMIQPGESQTAAVRAEVQKWVDQANEGVSRAESVRKFIILPEEFTQENGLMTASMKVIRPKVITRYATLLNTQMYTKKK